MRKMSDKAFKILNKIPGISCDYRFTLQDENGFTTHRGYSPYMVGKIIEYFLNDKDKNDIPELKQGCFVYVCSDYNGNSLGYVDITTNHIIYQDGDYDKIEDIKNNIVKIFSPNAFGYSGCTDKNLIWEKKYE